MNLQFRLQWVPVLYNLLRRNDCTSPLCLVAVTSAERPLVVLVGLDDLILSQCDSLEEDEINLNDLAVLVLGHRDPSGQERGSIEK